MVDTIEVLLDKQFVQIQRYDAQLHIAGRPVDEVATPVATFPARNAPMAVAFVPPGGLTLSGDHVLYLLGGVAIAEGGGGVGHGGVGRVVGQERRDVFHDCIQFGSHQFGGSQFDGFGALGGVAHHQHGFA